MKWTQQTPETLHTVAAHWRLVSAASWFDQLPGLRQKTLGQRAVLAIPQHADPLMLLRLPRRCAALDQSRFAAEPVDRTRAWVLALQADSGELRQGCPLLPKGPARFRWGEAGWPEVCWGESRLGSACHPLARDWAWAWVPTCGPVILRLYLQVSLAELGDWVENQCPGLWLRQGASGDLISRLSQDCRMCLAPGYLRLSRGRPAPPEQVDEDYFLLLALANGALGELQFDLFDGDYFRYVASGDGTQSFHGYLHARAGRGRPHRWNRFPKLPELDAMAADLDSGAALIGQAMGWGRLSLESLQRKFSETPVDQLPRHLQIRVRSSLWTTEVRESFQQAQPRIMFS